MESIILHAKQATLPEKKVVVLPKPIMPHLGVEGAEYVRVIAGDRHTVVKVIPTERVDYKTAGGITSCIVEMDSYTMKLLGVGNGGRIAVEPATIKKAKVVTLTPDKRISENDKAVVYRTLHGKPLSVGDRIPLNLPDAGKTILEVKEVLPYDCDAVIVDHDSTKIEFTKPVKKKGDFVIDVTFEDIGGYDEVKKKIREFVVAPLLHPDSYRLAGLAPPKGVLISGPSGSGKTMFVKAIVFETDAEFIHAHASDILSDSYTDSKSTLEELFDELKELAHANPPAILCIDDIELIAPRKSDPYDVEKKLSAALTHLMDKLDVPGAMVIGTTKSLDEIEPSLRRAGRFDREIEIPVPDVHTRAKILKALTEDIPLLIDFSVQHVKKVLGNIRGKWESQAKEILGGLSVVLRPEDVEEMIKNYDEEFYKFLRDKLLDEMLMDIAKRTHGFVAADLEALVKEALAVAVNRIRVAGYVTPDGALTREGISKLVVAKIDFEEALKRVEPSALREILIEVPEVRWDDIGGYDEVKQLLKEVVEWPLVKPHLFEATGITPPKGVLLYGPPGTGKTLLAKAVATESGANFIAVKGPEILSKWVGEGERKIREIFRKARQVAPTIIFFDEIDSIGQRRGSEKTQHVDSIINQLLTEMDGIESREKIVVIAATNRPDILDPALLRPGRFDRLVLIPAPDEKARLEILKVHTKNVPLASDVDLKSLARKTEGYSGADLEALVREATINAIRRVIKDIHDEATHDDIRRKVQVTAKDFEEAMKKVKASISKDLMNYYEHLERNLKSSIASKLTDQYGKIW